MPAITISREIGSLGDIIAEQTAKRLGYALVDKNLIEKVFRQFGFINFTETYDEAGFWSRFDPHRTETVHLLNRIIEAFVFHGNVILLGRGGFALLKGYADVLNVRIQAPLPLRVERVLHEQGLSSLAESEEFVKDTDRMRREFVESTYSHQWGSVSAFDLVIDTGKISPELAVSWLEAEITRMSHMHFNEMTTTRGLKIDTVLAKSVAEILDHQTT
ncbi:MAG: cytidylate kinase-like family protein [Chloroflexota bacterium]